MTNTKENIYTLSQFFHLKQICIKLSKSILPTENLYDVSSLVYVCAAVNKREPIEVTAAASVMVTLPERTDRLVTNTTDHTPLIYRSTPTPGERAQNHLQGLNANPMFSMYVMVNICIH